MPCRWNPVNKFFLLLLVCAAMLGACGLKEKRPSYLVLRQNAQKGDAEAQYAYAQFLEEHPLFCLSNETSLTWYTRSADQGNAQSLYHLTTGYFLNMGLTQDFNKAEYYGRRLYTSTTSSPGLRGAAAMFLAGIAFRNGNLAEGLNLAVHTMQSPTLAAECVFAVIVFVAAFLYYRYRTRHPDVSQTLSLMDGLIGILLMFGCMACVEWINILLCIPVLRIPTLVSSLLLSNIVLISALVYCAVLAHLRGIQLKMLFETRKIEWYTYPIWVVFGVIAMFILRIIYGIITVLFKIPVKVQMVHTLMSSVDDWRVFILIIIDGAFIAVLIEELFFRGIIHRILKTKLPAGAAVILSSAIFAAVHFDLWNFIPLFLTGVVLAIAYDMSKSIYVPILLHAANNLFAFGLLAVTKIYAG